MGIGSRCDVCVVIPTYNEVGTIGELVVSLLELDELSVRVLIVDDGSDDGTLEVLGELMGHYSNIVLVERGEKLGLGSALQEEFRPTYSIDDELRITIPRLKEYSERIEIKRKSIMPTVYWMK